VCIIVKWKLEGLYNTRVVEETVLSYWDERRIYELVKSETSKSSRVFRFVDGPPYPSSDVPHVGTALNKALKDSVLRFWRMRGYRIVSDQPGYDCHGLPIEVKVEQLLGVKSKRDIEAKIGVENFIEQCRRFALSNAKAMTKWFKELGVFMDWDNPYYTITNDYISAAWWLVKRADELGLLDIEHRVVYWCPRCSTTLAEYEVEYHEVEDPSIYVKFPVKEEPGTHLVVWTTTPWTLPANVFVMAHPDEVYVKLRVRGETWIIAKQRLKAFVEDCGVENYEVVEEIRGEDLAKYTYTHPLGDIIPLQEKLEKYHRVLLSREHVTMYEGTGLVHGAPGHGFEDYEVAVRNNMYETIVSPVDDEGKFTSEAGFIAGLYVRDANIEIINELRRRGYLIHSGLIKHRYPVCWRCKSPVVLRATRQWVIKVTRLKEKLLEEASQVTWIPPWALTRLENILENLQDWVISRQRYWGTPLPVWLCPNSHRVVVGSVEELAKYAGYTPQDLHKPWIDKVTFKCPYCGLEMRRVPDVIDVWLDSGVAFYASRGHPEKMSAEEAVVDFIVEGSDQIRGWFFSLLRSGVLVYGRAPYRVVLVHGFMLDEKGREMHKSLGNYVGTDEVIEKIGRDPLRLWLLSNTLWEDVKFSWRELEEARRDLSILWSVSVFAKTYMELDGFNPREHGFQAYKEALRVEDKWILSRINSLVREVIKHMESYRVHEAVKLIRVFLVEDLSHWYVRLIRPRVWIEENVADKMAAYATLFYVLDRLLRLLAPITPLITEYIYQVLYRDYYEKPSIHLLEYPQPDNSLISEDLERDMELVREVYSAVAGARMKAGLKLRQPVRRVIIYSSSPRVLEALKNLSEIAKFTCNTRHFEIVEASRIEEIRKYRVKPNYKSLGPRYRKLMSEITRHIEENSDIVAKSILSSGIYKCTLNGVEVVITKDDVEITPYYPEEYAVSDFKYGVVAVDTKISEEELAEGLARDVVRRVQVMRKMLKLPLTAKITAIVVAPDDKVRLLNSKREYIMSETRCINLLVTSDQMQAGKLGGLIEKWDINDEEYIIEVKPSE
jgi:isoleucyl-tRNA synthetase